MLQDVAVEREEGSVTFSEVEGKRLEVGVGFRNSPFLLFKFVGLLFSLNWEGLFQNGKRWVAKCGADNC